MQYHTNEHPHGARLPLFNVFSVGSRPSVYSTYTDVNIRRLTPTHCFGTAFYSRVWSPSLDSRTRGEWDSSAKKYCLLEFCILISKSHTYGGRDKKIPNNSAHWASFFFIVYHFKMIYLVS